MSYKVNFEGFGNIDHNENPFKKVSKSVVAEANTIQELREKAAEYIDKNNLGSGNWSFPFVYESGKIVGYIAYNCRFFSADTECCKELMKLRHQA